MEEAFGAFHVDKFEDETARGHKICDAAYK